MDLVKLTESIIKELVNDKESVSVKEFESENEDEILIQVMLTNEDIGKVIGRDGKVINAIRTIVQATSYVNDNKKVIINVDSF